MTAMMVTGHRKIIPAKLIGNPWPDNNIEVRIHQDMVVNNLITYIYNSITYGYTDFISGMALGADQLFAEAVLILKNQGKNIRLIAAVPFKGQQKNWPEKSQMVYNKMIEMADVVQIVSAGNYSAHKMQIRNEWMVDRADHVLAVWNLAQSGGTFNCVNYAVNSNKSIDVFNPESCVINKYK